MIEAAKICLFVFVLHVWGDRKDQLSLNGLLEQSIHLTNRLDFIQPVKEVSWYFASFEGKRRRICQCVNNISKPCGNEHFELHSNCMVLLIKNLTRADSGLYETHFILQDEMTESTSFNLTVYDPVPTPTISILGSINANSCNLTLHCSVTANVSALHYTWRSRSLAEEEVYSNISTMELSLNPKTWDNEYECVVHNHVSKNMASFIPRHTCLNLDNGHDRHNYYIILSLLVIVLPLLIWFAVVLNKTLKKEQDSAPEEVTYCEVGESKTDDMDCYQNIAQDTNVPMMTVYSLLQRDEK
uniref:Ig-like domain-containing protein n=1 Tax=Leptobrachium leishanense TaxID=445787 RepID=A0A8C5QV70_9ANUR